ncbi:hypothetical protein EDD16DRAFT_1730395 [Pisolithus croceorrhizus]|nr:hypothetical protein EDD16DRAFT_1730395 [Pisolithus croceorrhizus]KAI6116559.1 hypothetical protein EV401DRAFT_2197983 [Pisolithus croceorrhizus]KAI6159421.1 hypothetical protein EDD17DRAFT_1511346 [Pisolithus thermaeus]
MFRKSFVIPVVLTDSGIEGYLELVAVVIIHSAKAEISRNNPLRTKTQPSDASPKFTVSRPGRTVIHLISYDLGKRQGKNAQCCGVAFGVTASATVQTAGIRTKSTQPYLISGTITVRRDLPLIFGRITEILVLVPVPLLNGAIDPDEVPAMYLTACVVPVVELAPYLIGQAMTAGEAVGLHGVQTNVPSVPATIGVESATHASRHNN